MSKHPEVQQCVVSIERKARNERPVEFVSKRRATGSKNRSKSIDESNWSHNAEKLTSILRSPEMRSSRVQKRSKSVSFILNDDPSVGQTAASPNVSSVGRGLLEANTASRMSQKVRNDKSNGLVSQSTQVAQSSVESLKNRISTLENRNKCLERMNQAKANRIGELNEEKKQLLLQANEVENSNRHETTIEAAELHRLKQEIADLKDRLIGMNRRNIELFSENQKLKTCLRCLS